MLSSNALYTDLSRYYDLMCCDIDYHAQSHSVMRLHQMLGNGTLTHLDLACGTGPHLRHFIAAGYQSVGLDLNPPMLDIARQRCPEAAFLLQNMTDFTLAEPVSLITCFLYSIHYNPGIAALTRCIHSAHAALTAGGILCFNAVDKDKICNRSLVRHSTTYEDSQFAFESGWHYSGSGELQALKLRIAKTQGDNTQVWQDEHSMVAISFTELIALLSPFFEVHILAHDYHSIQRWDNNAGNALFACVKR